jgi:hypothetical protein
MEQSGLKIPGNLPIGSPMIGAVQLKMTAMQLDTAREALATAQQVAPAAGGDIAATADVVLELSAAAEQLMSQ